jgi:divinyl protochlorophyllide a 8-vinyl-reductase
MAKAPVGYLRRPAVAGFMAPACLTDLTDVLTAERGPEVTDRLLLEAQVHRLPGPDEPVREDKVARLHQAVLRSQKDEARGLLRAAGRRTAETLLKTQQSARAQAMLAGSPWPIAAWLLGRWASQHDWAFCGTGRFSVVTALEFELADNPLLRGATPAELGPPPCCHWHQALFERLFQVLVAPDLECRELVCAAAGAPACRFAIARS